MRVALVLCLVIVGSASPLPPARSASPPLAAPARLIVEFVARDGA